MTEFNVNEDLFRQAFLETAANQPDTHLAVAASSSGVAGCERQQVYRVLGTERAPSRPLMDIGEDRIAAKMGNAIEPETYAVLEAMGLALSHVQAAWAIMRCGEKLVCSFDTEAENDRFIRDRIRRHCTEVDSEHAGCHVVCTGHPDGVILSGMEPFLGHPQEAPVVLEVKYMNYRRFVSLAKCAGVINNDDDGMYYLQAQLNMEGLDLDHELLLAFSKDKTAVKMNRGRKDNRYEGHAFMHIEVVEKSEGAVKAGLERADEVNVAATAHRYNNELPAPTYTPVGDSRTSSWQCRWCDWHTRCLSDLEAEG